MVYADLLEARGEGDRAEMVRLQESFGAGAIDARREMRLRVLAPTVDPEWRARITRCGIEGCDAASCPSRWEVLDEDDDRYVRHCTTCDREVFFCTSLDDVRARGEAGELAAF